MNFRMLFKISLRSLKKHKGRSLLTILGIIVGIGAIIATLSIGYGAAEKQRQKILQMGKNFIILHSGKRGQEGKTTLSKRKPARSITDRDTAIFKEQIPEINKITPIRFAKEIISFEGNNIYVQILCANEEHLEAEGRKIEKGSFYTSQHVQKSSKVIVLGNKAAEELFGSLNPLGKMVKIRSTWYTVIGIVAKIKQQLFGIDDPNLECYIPITTSRKQIFNTTDLNVHGVFMSLHNIEDTKTVVKKLRNNLRFRHDLKPDEPDDFTILDQEGMLKAAQESSDILNLLLLIIASISLLVGGIGVMNIMLVSVAERTKEIGIRMALGANGKMIRKQFILESVVLCFIGGIIGIILGIITPYIASIFTGWGVIIKLSSILLAFFVTFSIGLVFGFYPAYKASKMNVVEALQET
jgi:putative ABC transport system permease protein